MRQTDAEASDPGRPPHHARRRRPRRPRSTSGRACSGCRSCSSSRTSTTPSESHLYFDPGDGRLITVFTNEERAPDPTRTPTDPGCVHHLAFARLAGHLRPGGRAARRARDPPQRRQGPRLHGLDLLRGSARPADRARLLPLRAAVRLHARRGAARGAQAPRRARRLQHRRDPPRRRDRGARQRARASRCPTTDRRRTPTADRHRTTRGGGSHGREHAQHPEAERQQPDRPHLRARRRARLRGGRRVGQEAARPSSSPRTRPT